MPTVLLSAKNVGDTIYIKENNTAQAYLIVHKGSPDTSKYVGFDNGVVVLRTKVQSSVILKVAVIVNVLHGITAKLITGGFALRAPTTAAMRMT